jgi:two-component system cell cycle sensor histidine kinase/response regulator CckA
MSMILVVDDDQRILKLLSTCLENAGHQVLTAPNGLNGLAVFRSNSDLIDLVITDLKMPEMNGYEMARRVREINPEVKIICMSGFAEEKCPECVRLLEKPFSMVELCAYLEEILTGPSRT